MSRLHLVTDRHSQVKSYMKKERPEIEHWFDCWHVAKGIYQKLEKKGKQKACKTLLDWARSISNYFYWCAASSGGDGELVHEKWASILNHVTNVHEGHGEKFRGCLHGPLQDRAWIKRDSAAFRELENVVNGRLLKQDVKKLSPAEQTSGLEAFHKVVCHFAPKLVHYFHPQMEARLYLAAMHFNENSNRPQSTTATGVPKFTLSYPKSRKGEDVAKQVKVNQTFDYVQEYDGGGLTRGAPQFILKSAGIFTVGQSKTGAIVAQHTTRTQTTDYRLSCQQIQQILNFIFVHFPV